jgi:nicotinate phosphoribosyltransferase
MHEQIIASLLDTDLYKVTLAQAVFHQFPSAMATYKFINRGKTPFPPGFGDLLEQHIQSLASLALSDEEYRWMQTKLYYLKATFLEWFRHYRFNPSEVTVHQSGSELSLQIHGPWYRTVFWEVPLMALISELFFRDKSPSAGWRQRIQDKASHLSQSGCRWIDFSTRRRFRWLIQDAVCNVMREWPGFLGTSNPLLAMRHGLTPHGTYPHEAIQAMQALYGVVRCNRMWMEHWVREYRGNLGIALTDTLTTDVFLRDFDMEFAKLFDGVRQDSGDPAAIGERMVAHYTKLHIDPASKRFVPSNGLTDQDLVDITHCFQGRLQVVGGIGTHLSNDVGHKPLNMVIKMVRAQFDSQPEMEVVKLSDDPGKHTGSMGRIAQVKTELGIS